jgi:hypothetical protein
MHHQFVHIHAHLKVLYVSPLNPLSNHVCSFVSLSYAHARRTNILQSTPPSEGNGDKFVAYSGWHTSLAYDMGIASGHDDKQRSTA